MRGAVHNQYCAVAKHIEALFVEYSLSDGKHELCFCNDSCSASLWRRGTISQMDGGGIDCGRLLLYSQVG